MTYCDHGSWKGPCSEAKHSAIRSGLNPWKLEDPILKAFEGFRWALLTTVAEPDGIHCRCCRERL